LNAPRFSRGVFFSQLERLRADKALHPSCEGGETTVQVQLAAPTAKASTDPVEACDAPPTAGGQIGFTGITSTMIVMKFGGTSVQDAAAIDRAANIVLGRLDRTPVVVVSALARVTEGLLGLAKTARERSIENSLTVIEELRARHLNTARKLLKNSTPS